MTTLALSAAVGLAIVGAGGTYAYLNSSAPASDAVVLTAGSASLTVSPTLTGLATTLYPGVTTYGSATVANTGDVALSVALSATTSSPAALASQLTLGFGWVPGSASCTDSFMPTWTGTIAEATGVSIPTTLTGSKTLCVTVALPLTAQNTSQNGSTSFTLTLTGTQASA